MHKCIGGKESGPRDGICVRYVIWMEWLCVLKELHLFWLAKGLWCAADGSGEVLGRVCYGEDDDGPQSESCCQQ